MPTDLTKKILAAKQVIPNRANSKVYTNGVPIFHLYGPRPWMIEAWLRDCDFTYNLDWHYSGGVAQVLSMSPDWHIEQLTRTIPDLAVACELAENDMGCSALVISLADKARFRAGVDVVPPGTLCVDEDA